MLKKLIAGMAMIAWLTNVSAADAPASGASAAQTPEDDVEIEMASNKEGTASASLPNPDLANFCFFAGTPPADVKYAVVKKLKVSKGTYGGVKDILPKFAGHAKKIGADAIIDYTGSQRFGFWPWRMVRPVVRGTAVKWSGTLGKDCTAMGGTTLSTILSADKPPTQ